MRYVVHSLGQLLFKISVIYLRSGYVYYTTGQIPDHKSPEAVDQKLVTKYQVTSCRMTRLRQRRKKISSVVYLRLNHRFIILATEGGHNFFESEQPYDCRQRPILISGYTVGISGGKPCVRIAPKRWEVICREAQKMALHNPAKVTNFMQRISPLTYKGINEQRLKLLRSINTRRRSAGLPKIIL
jgi:hypothetical protein